MWLFLSSNLHFKESKGTQIFVVLKKKQKSLSVLLRLATLSTRREEDEAFETWTAIGSCLEGGRIGGPGEWAPPNSKRHPGQGSLWLRRAKHCKTSSFLSPSVLSPISSAYCWRLTGLQHTPQATILQVRSRSKNQPSRRPKAAQAIKNLPTTTPISGITEP